MLEQYALVRQQHALEQGSDEWLSFKANHYGASEAAAMLGLSRKTGRNELLRLKATGVSKEFSDYVQKNILDKGHEIEALARPIAEEMIGDILYPTVWSYGRLSCSCDGLTAMDNEGWENKQHNEEYYNLVLNGEVPAEHMPQVQQCLLVTGADRWFFTVSDGTPERTVGVWVYPDTEWFKRIESGWEQFHKDLENYIPVEVIEPPKAEAIKDLPAVTIQVKGELTVSNLHDVTPMFDKFLREAKTELVTDNDFAQAEAEAKLGRETAKRCKLTAKAVVDQMLSISEVTRTLEEYAAKFDALALKQEKAVKEQKETRKAVAKLEREKSYAKHIEALNEFIKPIKLIVPDCDKPDFVGAMKNQRTLESLYNKLDTELARVKIAADLLTKDIQSKLDWFNDNYGAGNGVRGFWHLFPDMQSVIHNNQADSFRCVVESRIAADKKAEEAKLEAERERIRQEEEAKARREAEAKLRAEQAEKERVEREARQAAEAEERKRVAAETKRQLEEKLALANDSMKTSEALIDVIVSSEKLENAVSHSVFVPQEVTETAPDYIPVKPKYDHIIKIAVSAIATAEFITIEEAREFLFEAVLSDVQQVHE